MVRVDTERVDIERVLKVSMQVSEDTPVLAWYVVLMTINMIQCYSRSRDGNLIPDAVMKILGHLVSRRLLPAANEELVWTYVIRRFGKLERGRQGKADMAWVKRQREDARLIREAMEEEYSGRSIRETWLHMNARVRWPVSRPPVLTENTVWTLEDQLRYGGGMVLSLPHRLVDEPRPSVRFSFLDTETPTAQLPVVLVNGKIANRIRCGDGEYTMRSFYVDTYIDHDPFKENRIMIIYAVDTAEVDPLYYETAGALGSMHVEFMSNGDDVRDDANSRLPVVDLSTVVIPLSAKSRAGYGEHGGEEDGMLFPMDDEGHPEDERHEGEDGRDREKPFIFVKCGHHLTNSDIDVYRKFRECPVCGNLPDIADPEVVVARTSSPTPLLHSSR